MPYNEELGREYTQKEARFWREFRHAQMNSPYNVHPYDAAQAQGIDKQRMIQLLETWDNDGIIRFIRGANYKATLTRFGRTFTFEDRYSDIER